jgi:hypothetical protein
LGADRADGRREAKTALVAEEAVVDRFGRGAGRVLPADVHPDVLGAAADRPETHPTAWAIVVAYDRPIAALLSVCPESVRAGVVAVVNYRRPEGGWEMSCQRLPSGPTIGLYKRKRPGVIVDVRLW